jgi:hypothetical protein
MSGLLHFKVALSQVLESINIEAELEKGWNTLSISAFQPFLLSKIKKRNEL